MQEATQRLAVVVLGLLGDAGIGSPIEAVIRPRIHVKLDRHPGAAEAVLCDEHEAEQCRIFVQKRLPAAVCTIYDPRYPEPGARPFAIS